MMRMYDIIVDKRCGHTLSKEQIEFVVEGFTRGKIPDYQMSAWLMAVCLNGMNHEETLHLTRAMLHSGDRMDLTEIPGIKVDKHSTGGVGDKTTLIVCPIVAACGVPVAKMSGRSLGHTGGTLDKLESIPGMHTDLSKECFFKTLKSVGIAIAGQTVNIAPADKKIYALRDVTGTVESIPLIASSILSKKLAAGSDAIVLDVKTGSGAFMQSQKEAVELARTMVSIGSEMGKKMIAFITDMDVPLGNAIGNGLEVDESLQTLKGNGPQDLKTLCLHLAAAMLFLAGRGNRQECLQQAKIALENGHALKKFYEMVANQGGDIENLILEKPIAPALQEEIYYAPCEGFITHMDTRQLGITACILGAGRISKEDTIDASAGIYLLKKTGDYVKKGDALARLFTSTANVMTQACTSIGHVYRFDKVPSSVRPLILEEISYT